MADTQTQFQEFHRTILLDADSNGMLREKRETLLNDLANNIDTKAPSYKTFHQGSYALSTGVSPLDGDPDMDIGIVFDCRPEDYKDPVELKRFVKNALERHNRTVKIRTPCVTIQYIKGDVNEMHVDFAVYTRNGNDQTQLARGRDTDPADIQHRYWEPSEAQKLNDSIINAFTGNDREQWRRVVRSLKRWRDVKIGHKNIPSIALTVAAKDWFEADFSNVDGKPRDLISTLNFVKNLLSKWSGNRLKVSIATAPYCDLLEKVTQVQMDDFKDRLVKLRDALIEADAHADTHEACKILKKQFGDDFPVPDKPDTTQKTQSSFQSTGRSA
jgi:hypothetical protein